MKPETQAAAVLTGIVIVTILGFIAAVDILRKWSENRELGYNSTSQLIYVLIVTIGTIVLDFILYALLP
jgi:hypothetical protein